MLLTASAGIPDICISDYSITAPYEKYPFPTHKDTQIYFKIENIGTATANFIYLDMYVNDIKISADLNMQLDPLEPGYYYEWEMPFHWSEGKHTIKFVLNEYQGNIPPMQESNYVNNVGSITRNWKDYADLYPSYFDIKDGTRNFHALETKQFFGRIDNLGRAGVQEYTVVTSDKFGNTIAVYTASLEPNYSLEIVIEVTVGLKTSNAYFNLIASYNDDYDKSNNTKRSSTYQVEYALEFNGKIWSVDKLADLTVAICPSALQYASQFGVKDYEIIAALQKWNDVSISGRKIKITAMITNTEEPDADIKMIARVTHEDLEASAGTSLGEGGRYFVPRTVEIALNTFNPYGWEEHTAEQRRSTFTHEMGHALGLGESECLDQSVMVSDSFASNRKTYITAHDKYALNYLYTHV